MRSKLLTREMLENYGITEVTRDGIIYREGKQLKQHNYQKQGKYKLQKPYAMVTFGDRSQKIYTTTKKGYKTWTYKPVTLPVSRVVYTWFHGEIPEGYEIDHLDTNTLNNSLSNLRLLTKEENLARKPVSRNQYNCHKTDEEILAERENKKYIYDRTQHKQVKSEWFAAQGTEKKVKTAMEKAQEEIMKALWHNLNTKIKEKKAERATINKDEDMETWRKLGIEIELLKMAAMQTKKNMRK